MLNQYPDQTSARKGFALVGVLFLAFGFAMFLFESTVGTTIGICFGLMLFVPAIFFKHAAFQKTERVLFRLFAGL